jgi:hypothetical protein
MLDLDHMNASLDPIVDWVYDGFNGSIITLGEENSGKSSTLFGQSSGGGGGVGYIVDELFHKIEESKHSQTLKGKAGGVVLGISVWEVIGTHVIDVLKQIGRHEDSSSSSSSSQRQSHEFGKIQSDREGQFITVQVYERSEATNLIRQANDYRFKNKQHVNSVWRYGHFFVRFCLLNESQDYLSTLHVIDLASPPTPTSLHWPPHNNNNSDSLSSGGGGSSGTYDIQADRIGNFKQIEAIRKQTAASLFALNKIISELGKEENKSSLQNNSSNNNNNSIQATMSRLVLVSARDSVLTSMVAPLLGGNGRTWLLCCMKCDSAENAKFTLYSALKGKRYGFFFEAYIYLCIFQFFFF